MLGPEYDIICDAIPTDHSRSVDAADALRAAVPTDGRGLALLDFGCGDGRGLDLVRRVLPAAAYLGVDVALSPEVLSRTRADGDFRSYDGRTLPFEDAAFDIVYSRQVFEHVREPDRAMAEICRVLKPGGLALGSLSGLEPYHSFSIFNVTPYGLFRIVEDNGLRLRTMRPGVDGTALILRQLSMRRLKRMGFAYPAIAVAARLLRWDVKRVNYVKLRLAGHIVFIAEKPA